MRLQPLAAILVGLSACSGISKTAPHTPSVPPSMAPSVAAPSAAAPIAERAAPVAAGVSQLSAKSFPLPGATRPVTLDYIVYDGAHARVWVPVGDTGSADVLELGTSTFKRVDGFKNVEREVHGKKRMLGPSAVTVGDGVVYVGNRATSEVCVVDEKTLKLGSCLALPTPTDGVVYVASTKEVWVTTPRDHSLTILDASKPAVLKPKLVIKTEGEPEGYAVDATRGLFYTNLEDKNRTLVIDIKTHAIKASWSPGCGTDGPRGVAVDQARNFVFVACTDHVQVLDGRDGTLLGKLDTGAGVDNLEYESTPKLLYVAARSAARLTVARIDDKGQALVVATGTTSEGARNAVVDSSGNAYVADPQAACLLVYSAPNVTVP
jgi:DNA-binding beta-propeller fold protein YncE